MSRIMIHELNDAKHLWEETVNNACYVHNRIYIRHIRNKTLYELWNEIKSNISYYHQFCCSCFILKYK